MKTEIKARLKRNRLDGLAIDLYACLIKTYRNIIGLDQRKICQYLRESDVKMLHLGCGLNMLKDWLNTDGLPSSKEAVWLDATGTYPFPEASFDFVFSEHMIEHVAYADAQRMLKECFRVLKSGGRLRISTPDLAFLIGLYGDGKSELQRDYIDWSAKTLGDPAHREDVFVINMFVRAWGHTFIFNEGVLRSCMEQAGFANVIRCELNSSTATPLQNLENEERMPRGFLRLESLILEGIKR